MIFLMKFISICNDSMNYNEIIIQRLVIFKYSCLLVFEKDIKLLKRISLFDISHMTSIDDIVTIGLEISRIDRDTL